MDIPALFLFQIGVAGHKGRVPKQKAPGRKPCTKKSRA
nr:MAG TPA: hypothetical protein [Bacteriophage sp.]